MDQVIYEEEQWFPDLITAMAAAAGVGMVIALALLPLARWARPMLASTASFLGTLAIVAPMRTRVTSEGVRVTFGMLGWIPFRIAADQIRAVEPVTYRPLAEFGGLGIRFGRGGKRAYSARGDRGAHSDAVARVLIGSQRPRPSRTPCVGSLISRGERWHEASRVLVSSSARPRR